MDLQGIEILLQIRDAIGASLSSEQQLFVSEHYPKIANYMRTAQGRSAIQGFICNWQASIAPPAPPPKPVVVAEEVPEPVPMPRPVVLPLETVIQPVPTLPQSYA